MKTLVGFHAPPHPGPLPRFAAERENHSPWTSGIETGSPRGSIPRVYFASIRELREEISLAVPAAPRRLFKIDAGAETGEEFVWVYRCEAEGPFALHPEEIERGGWFAPDEVTRWIAERPEEFASAFVLLWYKVQAV